MISAGLSIMDPEPTTVLHFPAADSTTVVVPAGPQWDDDPTIVWATREGAGRDGAGGEEVTARTRTAEPTDEPTTVVDVSAGEPTVVVADCGPDRSSRERFAPSSTRTRR